VTPATRRRAAAGRPAPARDAAVRVLERVERDAAYADLALEAELGRRRLGPRDAALATELVFGTLRWQRYLDWILAPHSRRRLAALDPRVRVLLRVTAYQLAFLERVPPFAAVNDAVSLARGRPGVAEYVNAVLRAFARRGVREREPAPPRDPLEALATRCSFPTWLATRWVARFGREEAEALMRAFNERASSPAIRTTLKANPSSSTATTMRFIKASFKTLPTPLNSGKSRLCMMSINPAPDVGHAAGSGAAAALGGNLIKISKPAALDHGKATSKAA